ncbi:MAG: bifunctional homocysteine S-methyltransferase/methylenetetrahydrofolate reductase [Butyricicoccus sp.]
MKPIAEYLQTQKLLTDGAFGTYYAEKYQTEDSPELANLEHPERVLEIHREYIEAGAKLLRTNTFTANFVHFHDAEQVDRIVHAAVQLARLAADGREIYIAGDIGAISDYHLRESEEKTQEYIRLGRLFLNEGVDILLFETVSSPDCVLEALRALKKEHSFYAMVQFSVNQYGYCGAGLSARRLMKEIAAADEVDAAGFNCGIGPAHMEQVLRRLETGSGKPLVAMPNAGYPQYVRNQVQFSSNAEYFALKLGDLAAQGADIIGGCCGTNPHFIQTVADTVSLQPTETMRLDARAEQDAPAPEDGSFFAGKTGKLYAVELAPPLGANDEALMDAAHLLEQAGVDVVTFPDSPSGRTRADSVLMAEKVSQETGLCVMPHICCRDKNAIAIRSQMLGAQLNGIRNMLVITGDPVPMMARESVKSVFNFDSVGMMNIIRDMNEEVFPHKPITYGGAINQGRRNLDVEIGRVKKKMQAGASFFFTQPVFGQEHVDRLRRIKDETGARILCGIMPLVSRRNALFIKNEMTGIAVTDEIVAQYGENLTREQGEAVGVRIARDVIRMTEDFVDGYYFSFPFNRVYLLEQILEK